MYIPRFLVMVIPAPQGKWQWFRRRCSIAILDTSKINKDTNIINLTECYVLRQKEKWKQWGFYT